MPYYATFSHVPSILTEEQVNKLFNLCGKVQEMHLFRDSTNEDLRVITVMFEEESARKVALHLTDSYLFGIMIKSQVAHSWPTGLTRITFDNEEIEPLNAPQPVTKVENSEAEDGTGETAEQTVGYLDANPITSEDEKKPLKQAAEDELPTNIYVGNLSPSVRKLDLVLLFTKCGVVKDAKIYNDDNYACLTYSTKSSAENALQLDRSKINQEGYETTISLDSKEVVPKKSKNDYGSNEEDERDGKRPKRSERGRDRSRSRSVSPDHHKKHKHKKHKHKHKHRHHRSRSRSRSPDDRRRRDRDSRRHRY